MPKFRKKPVVIEAVQWFKLGDHPAVVPVPSNHPSWNNADRAEKCGWIKTREGGADGAQFVVPSDWIITGVEGEHYPCQDATFRKTYEAVDQDNVAIPRTGMHAEAVA